MSDYFDDDELLQDFYAEAEEQVEKLEQNILAMEGAPDDKDSIDEIFRAAHTLKGGSATVHMTELAEFTHAMEDLLDGIRNDECKVTGEIIDNLLAGLDVIKAMLAARRNGNVYKEDVAALKETLRSFVGVKNPKPRVAPKPAPQQPIAAMDQGTKSGPSELITEADLHEMFDAARGKGSVYRIRVEFDENNPMNSVGGIQVFAVLKTVGQVLRTFPDFDSLYEDNFFSYVDYYLLSSASETTLQTSSMLDDVTLGSSVVNLDKLLAEFPSENILSPAPPSPVDPVPEPPRQEESARIDANDAPLFLEEDEEIVFSEDRVASGAQTAAPVDESFDKKGQGTLSDQAAKTLARQAVEKRAKRTTKKVEASQILRVDNKRIDTLLNLVSEIVITRGSFNQLAALFTAATAAYQQARIASTSSIRELMENLSHVQERLVSGEMDLKTFRRTMAATAEKATVGYDVFENGYKVAMNKLRAISSTLARSTTDLHESVLKIRMVPVDQVFQRFPRLVRDLTKTLDKDVHLVIEGGDTEMDKTVTEELFDPLMHCVRNSMDHGFESAEERIKAGKNPQGTLALRASNQGNLVLIEIADDGRGIDVDAVKNKAIERGLLHSDKPITDQEAFNLILEPGFSTARQVTDLSGRGVGLDVVRKSIEKLNGELSIWSEAGKGSTFTIRLPLTLAIIQGLMVRVGKGIFVIPITNVMESFRLKPSEINKLDNYEVFNVRDDVVSILRLGKLFRMPSDGNQDYYFVVVVGSGDKKVGLMVDALLGEEDVVIKPLKDQYTLSPGIAGATILGDGTVSLIIDVSQIVGLGLRRDLDERVERLKQSQQFFDVGL